MHEYRTSYFSRFIGLLIGGVPFFVAGLSLYWADVSVSLLSAMIVGSFGILVGLMNLWVSTVRPSLWMRRHQNMNGYKHGSVLSGLGTILGLACCSLGFGSLTPTLMATFVFIVDLGGVPWFIYATWQDKSFWDKPINKNV